MTSKKNQIRIFVVSLIVFLTLSYVLAQGQEEKPTEEIPQENSPPQIVSVEFDNVQNEYTMTVTVEDRDSESLEIEVQYIGGRPDLILFPQSTMPIGESKGGTFMSDPFPLAPGYHTFMITVADSDDNQVEMSVQLFVPESVVQPTDQPPQIVAVGFSNEGNNYIITIEIEDEDPGSVHVEIEGAPDAIFTGEGTTFTSNQFSLSLGLNMLIIIATDSQGNQGEMHTPSINGGRSFIILIILLLSAIVILEIFFFRRRSERTESIEGILYCKQCKAPLEPSDDLEKENILEELRKKLDYGEITEEEYHKIAKSLKEGFQ